MLLFRFRTAIATETCFRPRRNRHRGGLSRRTPAPDRTEWVSTPEATDVLSPADMGRGVWELGPSI
jgi:hypothetical protein